MPAHRPGFFRQDEERRLEGVVRCVVIAEDPPAGAEHHRPVAIHECGEGRLITIAVEASDQFPIRRRIGVGLPHPGELFHERWHRRLRCVR